MGLRSGLEDVEETKIVYPYQGWNSHMSSPAIPTEIGLLIGATLAWSEVVLVISETEVWKL